jgi:Xaa-Pro aminopeptidase
MLDAEGCAGRRARLLERLGGEETLVLVCSKRHVYYLTGYWASLNSLTADAPAWLLIRPSGRSVLLVDDKQGAARSQAHVDDVETFPYYGLSTPARNRWAGLNALLGETLKRGGGSAECVACEMELTPAGVVEALTEAGLPRPSVDATPVLEAMRRVKDADELALIRRCVGVVEAVHAASREVLAPGMTELELYGELEKAALRAAGEPVVMRCDVAGSPRPKGTPPLGLTLESGMLAILDIFPVLRGYRADFTNTLAVGGKPSGRQEELMALCREAMAAGEAMLRAGTRACDVYAAVRSVFEEAGEADLFPHHAGHGLGLDHPEAPFLIPLDTEPLAEGAVMAMEPGLYDPEAGGVRIENNYLITAGGFERLSDHEIGL